MSTTRESTATTSTTTTSTTATAGTSQASAIQSPVMTVPTMTTAPLANPSINWDAKDLACEFRNFKEVCQLMFAGPLMHLLDDSKFSYIILWAGSKAIEIWRNSGQTDRTPEAIYNVLESHCIPSDRSFWSHRMEMRYLQQRPGETIKDFASRVSSLAALCEWKDPEEQIVSTVIFGCRHREAQRSILGKPKDITLNDCIKHIANYEATEKHLKDLQSIKTTGDVNVNAITSQKKCFNCGKLHPRGQCPALGNICGYCGKANHYESVCLSKKKNGEHGEQKSNTRRPRSLSRGPGPGRRQQNKQRNYKQPQAQTKSGKNDKKVSSIQANNQTLVDDTSEFYCYRIQNKGNATKDVSDATILFHGTEKQAKVFCKIDTGADITVMPARVYKSIRPDNVLNGRIHGLQPTRMKLTAYNNTTIPCIGETTLKATHSDITEEIRVIVTPERRTCTVLGKHDAVKLKCIQFLCETHKCVQCHEQADIRSVNTTPATERLTTKWKHILPLGKLTGDPKQDLLQTFPSVFTGIGQFDGTYKIELRENAKPVQHAPRRVPESLKPEIRKELDRLVREDIIRPVAEATDWVNSLVYVTKESGELRLCLDPKDLNKCVKRPHYYTPTIDDVLPELHGAEYISTLDARSGYWNVMLDPESQLLTTFNTPGFGRFCFRRLPFGLISSQDIFQRQIDTALGGLSNVKCIADDIKIHGNSEIEHDISILEACERCARTGLKLNPKKCQVKQKSVNFFGNELTTNGLRPDKAKVQAILDLPAPADKLEARALIGMVSYLQRFIPNSSKLLEPIRQLTTNKTEFYWDANLDKTLEQIKEAVSSASTLAYFNHTAATEIQCDASKKGLGACMLQNGQPISFASKSLTKAESNYSNIEREALGVVFALTKFHQYTFGRHVTVITDHKPLEVIFKKSLADVPPRLQRMILRVQPYDFTIKYCPGKDIPVPDCLSRLIPTTRNDMPIDGMTVHINTVIAASGTKLQQLQDHTNCDTTLLQLRDTVQQGWPNDRTECPTDLLPYWPFREEIGYYNGVLVKGHRAIIPESLREAVLLDVHRGHQGIEKCRLRARQSVYWPRVNDDITQMVNRCDICQRNGNAQPHDYSMSIQMDSHYPMHRIGTDLFHWNGQDYLILVDYYSSFPWIRALSRTTSSEVICHLKNIFSEYGIPLHVHSDSGSQYTSQEFANFAEEYGFKHTTSSPYYHQSNGKAERYVGIVKQLLTKAFEADEDPMLAILAYRATPLSAKKLSPGELMFGRKLRDTILSLPLQQTDTTDVHDEYPTDSSYTYAPLQRGDPIYILNTLTGKWEPGQVMEKADQPHQYLVKFENGRQCLRNRVHIKLADHQKAPLQFATQAPPAMHHPAAMPYIVPQHITATGIANRPPVRMQSPEAPSDEPPPATDGSVAYEPLAATAEPPSMANELPPEPLRKSKRARKCPSHLKDYVLT